MRTLRKCCGPKPPKRALLWIARLFEGGAEKYDDRNWELGIPLHAYYNSAHRHFIQYHIHDRQERHFVHYAWNILCLRHTVDRILDGSLPENLDNRPATMRTGDQPNSYYESLNLLQDWWHAGSDDHLSLATERAMLELERNIEENPDDY